MGCPAMFAGSLVREVSPLASLFMTFLLGRAGSMITRSSKLMLVAGIALFYALVVFNNVTDFDSNYQFVRHVLMMDSTFPGNVGLWRALRSPGFHLAFYISIIAWEIATAILVWWGSVRMVRALRRPV